MKSTSLTTALNRLQHCERELVELENLKVATEAAVADLAVNCSLRDEQALAAIGRGQILLAILPARQAAREAAVISARTDLLTAAHGFISQNLSPRCRALLERARQQARAVLAPNIADPETLELAIEQSKSVQIGHRLLFAVTITDVPPDGPAGYAKRLLAADAELIELEAAGN